MYKRRTFIKGVAAAVVVGFISPKIMLANKKSRTIGIQLYTLRDLIAENFEEVLGIVSDIGYKTVEAAGYSDRKFYGYFPGEYKKILADYDLTPISSHAKFSLRDAPKVIEDTVESGAKYLIYPWLKQSERKSIDSYKKLADEFNRIGSLCNAAGLTFGYHNHAFEFEDIGDIIPYNVLLENTEPSMVCMELDLYWIMKAGYNPQEYFDLYPGRFKLWHIKDMDESKEMNFAPVGKGIINFQSIFKQKEKAGLEYSFVEQDTHSNDDPVQNIKDSYRYLNNLPSYE